MTAEDAERNIVVRLDQCDGGRRVMGVGKKDSAVYVISEDPEAYLSNLATEQSGGGKKG